MSANGDVRAMSANFGRTAAANALSDVCATQLHLAPEMVLEAGQARTRMPFLPLQ